MSIIPETLKIAEPYARSFYSVSASLDKVFEISRDFQGLEVLFRQSPTLTKYLANPIISPDEKRETIEKILKSKYLVHIQLSKFNGNTCLILF